MFCKTKTYLRIESILNLFFIFLNNFFLKKTLICVALLLIIPYIYIIILKNNLRK